MNSSIWSIKFGLMLTVAIVMWSACSHANLVTNLIGSPMRAVGGRSAYRDLSSYLKRATTSSNLEDNLKIIQQLVATDLVRFERYGRKFKQLARAFAHLVQPNAQDNERLCSIKNLSNLRILAEAMRTSYRAPTKEPENKKRLNLLVIKMAAEVRSFCYEQLRSKWLARSSSDHFTQLDGLEQLDAAFPVDLLLEQQIKKGTPLASAKFDEQLGKMLLVQTENSPDGRSLTTNDLNGARLQQPCSDLVNSEMAQYILAPAVDLGTINLIVFGLTDLPRLDGEKHKIKPLARYLMCKRLLSRSKRAKRRLEKNRLDALGHSGQGRQRSLTEKLD